jgi:membrane associated rhomboid family serine protease
MVIPGTFVFVFWIIYILEISFGISLSSYGLSPREFKQWYGILTFPFLHQGIEHIVSNTGSFFILGSMIFYFYNDKALNIFLWSYFLSGIFTWIIGRPSIHIGASAMIYSFAGFLLTSGIISKNVRNLSVTLIVVFLYGSMVWGIFPQNTNISWEGHLSGFITGIILAIIFKPNQEATSVDENEDDSNNNFDYTFDDEFKIKYHYRNDNRKTL